MNILHTVEFYNPSIGGAQEVVRQVSEQLTRRGHTVTVATNFHRDRRVFELNGVRIKQFNIHGNAVLGYHGEVVRYHDFLRHGNFDLMMNYAAQQWATDLVFSDLDLLPFKKVFIPCGFSALYDPAYATYFNEMPAVMRHYDHLVFHADHYRDTNFARRYNIPHLSIIPNGALRAEFENPDPTFRQRYGIPRDVPLLLTVGTHTGIKGHRLALEAFRRLQTPRAALVIIGNTMEPGNLWRNAIRPILGATKRREWHRLLYLLHQSLRGETGTGCLAECRAIAQDINRAFAPGKQVFLLDPPRADVVAAYHAADLFIFGSNIEYSPLVLFEALASKTPFLSLDCGNAAEIVAWSGGGRIASTLHRTGGFVDADPTSFACEIDEMLHHPDELSKLAGQGYIAWLERFTWEKLSAEYESLYLNLINKPAQP